MTTPPGPRPGTNVLVLSMSLRQPSFPVPFHSPSLSAAESRQLGTQRGSKTRPQAQVRHLDLEKIPLNYPLLLFIEPLGTVDKATAPQAWWRLTLDARLSNEFQDPWGSGTSRSPSWPRYWMYVISCLLRISTSRKRVTSASLNRETVLVTHFHHRRERADRPALALCHDLGL